MKRFLTTILLLSALRASAAEFVPVDGFAATVNKRVITVGEVMSALQPLDRQLRASYSGRELTARLEDAYQRVLNNLIEHNLILEEFEKREGMIPSQVIDEHIQSIVTDSFSGDRAAFLRQLALEGISMEEWRADVRDRIAVMVLRREEVFPNVVISPRQMRNAYEQRMDEFRQPGQTHVRMIVILRTPEEQDDADPAALAQSVYEQAKSGTDFAELARTHSQDARAERGGDWGWIDPGILRAELAATVKELKPGQISEPVDSAEALYIVKVEDRRSAKVTPFPDVRDQLADDLRRSEEDRIYRAWITRLKSMHHVQIYGLPRTELSF